MPKQNPYEIPSFNRRLNHPSHGRGMNIGRIVKHPPLAPKSQNVQERKLRKGVLETKSQNVPTETQRSGWCGQLPHQIRNAVMVLYPLMIQAERWSKHHHPLETCKRQQRTFDPASLDAKCCTMRAENAPVYATKQAIRLPRVVLSMGMTGTR